MSDLISRDDAIAYIRDHFCNKCDTYNGVKCVFCDTGDAISALKDVPAVDAEPVRHGRWIETKGAIRCSECANTPLYDYHGRIVLSKVCPHCYAKMEQEDTKNEND